MDRKVTEIYALPSGRRARWMLVAILIGAGPLLGELLFRSGRAGPRMILRRARRAGLSSLDRRGIFS